MGYIAHDVVVAVVSDYDKKTIAAIEAFRSALPEEYAKYLVGPVHGVNGYDAYCFLPDGSKEGWESSDLASDYRAEFAEIAKGERYRNGSGSGDVVGIRFGGDFGREIGTTITQTTDPLVAAALRALTAKLRGK